jgi:hypothetical protein
VRNEVLAKFVRHNVTCLIHAIGEFGIDPTFKAAVPLLPARQKGAYGTPAY